MKIKIAMITLLGMSIAVNAQTSQITETSDGKVGIGIKIPTQKLQIAGTESDRVLLSHKEVNYNKNSPKLSFFGYTHGPQITGPSIQKISTVGYGRGRLAFFQHGGEDYTSETEVMSIDYNGNVGIGTTAPSQKLEIFNANAFNTNMEAQSQDHITFSSNEHGNGSYFGGMSWKSGGRRRAGIAATREHSDQDHVGLAFFTKGTDGPGPFAESMRISYGGNVGIGTSTPDTNSKLTVAGNINVGGNLNASILVRHINGKVPNSSALGNLYLNYSTGKNVWVGGSSGTKSDLLVPNGNVAIGTTDTKGFKLGVNGKIAATEVKVATYGNWADFVFAKGYNLPTLQEVENHIKTKGHLENIPSAEEVKRDGFFLGNMDAKLLQKIEELTLYTIQQEKEIKKLKEENKKLQNLSDRLAKLEKLLEKQTNK